MRVDRTLRVFFVCVENSNRSQMAEAFARIHGGAWVDAASADSRPSGRVNPKTIAAMRAKGYDLASHRSKSITEVGPGPLDAVVTMRCGDACPDVAAKAREDWSITDPRNMDEREFGLVRDRIEGEVVALLARLALPSS